jgi:hypothetical protein
VTEPDTEPGEDPTEPPTKTPEDPTEEPTKAPEDLTEAPTAAPEDPTDEPKPGKKGCGSAIGFSALLILGGAALMIRKKRED